MYRQQYLEHEVARLQRLIFLAMVLSLIVVGLSSCKTEDTRPNIVLIVIDTLRADHLPTYGYNRKTTPFITSLAERGCLFENT